MFHTNFYPQSALYTTYPKIQPLNKDVGKKITICSTQHITNENLMEILSISDQVEQARKYAWEIKKLYEETRGLNKNIANWLPYKEADATYLKVFQTFQETFEKYKVIAIIRTN